MIGRKIFVEDYEISALEVDRDKELERGKLAAIDRLNRWLQEEKSVRVINIIETSYTGYSLEDAPFFYKLVVFYEAE